MKAKKKSLNLAKKHTQIEDSFSYQFPNCLYSLCFLWGVAVLEIVSHPDHNKGPD